MVVESRPLIDDLGLAFLRIITPWLASLPKSILSQNQMMIYKQPYYILGFIHTLLLLCYCHFV